MTAKISLVRFNCGWYHCVSEKKVSEKKPGNKDFGKQFSEVLGQNVNGNKDLSFKLLRLFFPKIIRFTNKVLGNRITGIKVLKS